MKKRNKWIKKWSNRFKEGNPYHLKSWFNPPRSASSPQKTKKESHPTTSTIKKTESKWKQIELLLHFRIERDKKKTSRKECEELHKTKTFLLLLLLGVFQSLLSIVNGKLGFFFFFPLLSSFELFLLSLLLLLFLYLSVWFEVFRI